jgi:hypothetical protein
VESKLTSLHAIAQRNFCSGNSTSIINPASYKTQTPQSGNKLATFEGKVNGKAQRKSSKERGISQKQKLKVLDLSISYP